jgi:FkbM family methyltransferase
MRNKIASKVFMRLKNEYSFYKKNYFTSEESNFENIPKKFLRKVYPNCKAIIDCGAHMGADSIELARFFPKATIYAFEPVPHLFKQLKHNTRRFANIKCFELALSSENCKMEMHVSSGGSDASSSLLSPKDHLTDHPDTFFRQKVEVTCITLDSWAEANKIDKIDLLWLDMQGFELSMLQASKNILGTVSVIHSEVNTKETYVGAGLYPELKAFLANKGFKVRIEALPQGWDMGNVLFVKQGID